MVEDAPSGAGAAHYLRPGVRQKVVLILVTTLLITLTVNTWLSFAAQERDILNETNRRGAEITQFIAQYLAYSVVGHDYHTIELLIQELTASEDIAYARVVSAKGNTLAVTGNAAPAQTTVVPFRHDIVLVGEKLGEVQIGLSTQRIVAQLREERRASIWRQLLVILVVLLVEFAALSYIIVRPIGIISRVIAAGSAGGRVAPIPIATHDEFGDMAREFNALHTRLNAANAKLEERVVLANEELRQANTQLRDQADELMAMNRELEQLAVTDALTGLYNRRHFERIMHNEVEHAVQRDETRSIILLDIDHFKQYNSGYGHRVGDEILRVVAKRLRAQLRPGDMACRYGGDEFFVLCRDATIATALNLAAEIQHAVTDRPFFIDGHEIALTLSIGVATIPGVQPVTNADAFFRCADAALAHSKLQGRNRVTHSSLLDRAARSPAA